jgi:hypothetical protein
MWWQETEDYKRTKLGIIIKTKKGKAGTSTRIDN